MTKEELKQYLHIKRERQQIASLLAELEATMAAPATQKLTGMPRNPSGHKSSVETMVERHTALLEQYREKLEQLDEAQAKIEAAIETLDSVERTLMRHRYIEGMKWEEICVEMSYCWRNVHNIHAAALQKLKKDEETLE